MKRIFRNLLLMFADIIFVTISTFMASLIIFNNFNFYNGVQFELLTVMLIFSASAFISNNVMDCYSNIWRHAGTVEVLRQGFAALMSFLLNIIAVFAFTMIRNVPFNISLNFIFLANVFEFLFMTFFRFTYRIITQAEYSFLNIFYKKSEKKAVVFCNVDIAKFIIDAVRNEKKVKLNITAVITSENVMYGNSLAGIHVIGGGVLALEEYIEKNKPDIVIVTKNSFEGGQLSEIYEICKKSDCDLKVFSDVADYKNDTESGIRNLDINDLLGRTAFDFDDTEVKKYIQGKIVLVTGAAGSIGSELCRQILKYNCAKLVALDIDENDLFYLEEELSQQYSKDRFEIVLGSIRDKARLDSVFRKYHPETVFHAAAHKHVPMMENNEIEAIKNNVFGTKKLCEKSVEYGVKKFILISTDKAVNPTNVMGATKRIAELIIQNMNKKFAGIEFAAVRFGNVLGSNGSVILTFKKQIESGGPVTVTHPDIKRYFMTIMEAVNLVLNAGSIARGGEIFVLDMGKQIKIDDLARDMIRLAGLVPDKDIKIVYTGLRKGEKMFEELNLGEEKLGLTKKEKIFILKITNDCEDFDEKIEDLHKLVKNNEDIDYRYAIKNIVEEFNVPILESATTVSTDDEE